MEVINTSAEPAAPAAAAVATAAAGDATAAGVGGEFAAFEMPSLQCNEDGWGPCELSNTFRDMPYQPFSKSDRMGKISDWTGSSLNDKKFSSKWLSDDSGGWPSFRAVCARFFLLSWVVWMAVGCFAVCF